MLETLFCDEACLELLQLLLYVYGTADHTVRSSQDRDINIKARRTFFL